eukprot:gi/632957381/ref/XP_007894445.1/ PREDICTED: LOW QUALITY PROTEIN: tenascin [Callorhinchus milii]
MGLQWQALACILSAILLGQAQGGVLKDILRHKRSPVEPEEENVTLPLGTQPINFNHVYNINVPLGALCSVDLDSPDGSALSATADSGDHHIEHTVDGENQIVFTHRINIPRQACACGQAPDLQDLLQRLELLEGQVSSLRDQCANGGCCGNGAQSGTGKAKRSPRGNAGLGGEGGGEEGRPPPTLSKREIFSLDLSPGSKISRVKCNRPIHSWLRVIARRVDVKPFCGGHGNYSTDSCGGCVCDPGWSGPNCTEPRCPDDCGDQGRCVDGACQCFEGYAGAGCDRELCPVDCGQHGRCADGECVCDEGFTDHDCSEIICPRDCYDRGRCVEGQCFCDQGFTGEDCGELSCPSDCHDRGACVEGRCLCREGFAGEDCGELSCPGDCRQRGACVRGRCVCGEGYAGEDCGRVRCPHDCHDRGRCVDGRCLCQEGFAGEDCGEPTCPGDCHQRGRCANGQCVCDEGFAGADCGELACPDRCNNRGRCLAGQCVCIHPFTGPSCALLACANHCSHRGRCVDGRCVCDEGYIQEDCSAVSPAKNLKVTEVTPETLDLEWYNEVRVNEYLITYVPTSPGGLQLEMRVDGDKMSSTVQELEPGVEYFINVYAILNNHRSVPVSARVATHLPTPDGLRFKSVKETSVHVAWDPLDIPFDGWELVFKAPKEDNGEISHNLKQDQLSVTQTGLAPGEEYDVSLYIIKNQTRGPEFKKPLTTMIDSPSEVEVNKVTDTTAHVTWFKPAARIDGINLSYGTPGGERTTVQLPDTESTHSISGLEPDTEYQVSLVSNRGQMQSVPATNTFRTDIDAPQNLRVVTQTDQSITLQWKNTRAPAGSYRVKYAPLSGGKHMETIVERSNEANTKITMTGLQPGTEYGFGVSAFQGNNRESAPATINAATELDDPKDLEVSERTVDSITLRWHRPQAVIKQYRIYYITPSGQRSEQIVRGDAITFILVDLDAGLEYTITLVAERDSEKSQGVTITSATGLEALGGLRFSAVTSVSTWVDWDAPSHPVDMYIVNYNPKTHRETRRVTVEGNQTAVTLLDLKPATEYTVTLVALQGKATTEPLVGSVTTALPDAALVETFTPGPYGSLTAPNVSLALVGSEMEYSGTGEGEISNITVSDVTSGGLRVSWTAAIGVYDHFVIEYRDEFAGASDKAEVSVPGDALSADLTGLSPSTPYNITLYGIVGDQRSQPLNTVVGTASLTTPFEEPASHTAAPTAQLHREASLTPHSPTIDSGKGVTRSKLGDLTVTDATSQSLKLSWNAGNGSFDSFLVVVRDSAGVYRPLEIPLSGDIRNAEVSGLSDSTHYKVYLYGVTGEWRSDPLKADITTAFRVTPGGDKISDEAPSSSPTQQTYERNYPMDRPAGVKSETPVTPAPGKYLTDLLSSGNDKPGSLAVKNVTPTSFQLSWTIPKGTFDSFLLTVQNVAEMSSPTEIALSGEQHTADVSGLLAGTHYEIDLYGIVQGQLLQPLKAFATTGIPELCVLHTHTYPSLAFHFLTSYPLLEPHPHPHPSRRTDFYTRPRIFFPLPVSSMFHCVYAGKLEWSEIVLLLCELLRLCNIQIIASFSEAEPELGNLMVSDITPSSFKLSWTALGPYEGFDVEIRDSDGLLDPINLTLAADVRFLDVPQLSADTDYEISFYGLIHGQRTKPLYAEASTADEPELGNLTVSNMTSDGFTVSWAANGTFENFIVDITDPNRFLETSEHIVPAGLQSIDISNLLASTDYVIYLSGVYQGQRSHTFTAVATTGICVSAGVCQLPFHFTSQAEPELGNLVVSDITSKSFALSWTGKEGAFESFVVELIDSDRFSDPVEYTAPGDVQTTQLTNLIPATNYVIYLYGVIRGHRTRPLTTVALTGTCSNSQEEPELGNLIVSDITSGGFTLSWTAEDEAFQYFVIEVRDSNSSANPLQQALSGKTRTADISGLRQGTGYHVNVFGAVHGRLTSPLTAVTATERASCPRHFVTHTLMLLFPKRKQFPVSPEENPKLENLVVSDINSYGFRVTWDAVDGAYESFNVVVRDSGRLLDPLEHQVSGDQHTIDITGLITGIGYDIYVSGVAKGQQSKPLFAETTTEAEPELDNLSVSNVTSDGFTLTWTTDDSAFDIFHIKIRDSQKESAPLDHSVAGELRTADIRGLRDGTEYEITVHGIAEGQRSQALSTVANTALGAPRGLRFENVTDSTVTLRWDHPRAKVNSFRITYVPTDGGAFQSVVVDGTKTKTTLYKLIPATEYRITIVSLKGFEESESISDTVLTVLDNPSALGVVNVTDSEALLVWQPTIAAVDGYVIAYTADYGITETEQVSGNTVQAELISLHPGTHYTVWMHAVKGSLQSLVSSTTFTTAIDPPTDLRASEITTNNALLSWKVPTAQITGYTLTLESTDGNMQQVVLSDTDTSYSLAQLVPSMRYHVKLQANKGSQRSKIAETFFTAGRVLYPHPKDCSQTLLNGEASSGLYTIFLNGNMSDPLKVYCDMTTDGGGWVVFQRRQNGNVNFYRNWRNYSAGFGDPSDEFWLGLQSLHKITSHGRYELRVDLRDEGNSAYAVYDKFLVTDPRSRYKLHIGEYSGTAGDSLTYHQGRPFSTKDRDNDIAVTNCALSYKGAWWYKNCHRVNLNGVYGNRRHSQGINWYHWKGHEHSISFVEMKLRPHNFRDLQQRKRRQPAAR